MEKIRITGNQMNNPEAKPSGYQPVMPVLLKD